MAPSRLSLGLSKLDELGFQSSGFSGSVRSFDGELKCVKGAVKVRVFIEDWNFTTYPMIVVLDRPAFLPALTPHVSGGGVLCYFVDGRVLLDFYRPDHAIGQCLAQARDELDRLCADPLYREKEFEHEFGANWEIGQIPRPSPLLLATIYPNATSAVLFQIALDEKSACHVVASSEEEVAALAKARGWPAPTEASASCFIVRSSCAPSLPTEGLPTHVAQMFNWIASWDPAAKKQIQTALGAREWLKSNMVMFLISTKAGWFGFRFDLDANRKLMDARHPARYRQYLHSHGQDYPVVRVGVYEISPSFVHSRNLQFENLQGRTIILIGCGAIGGYAAQALAKLGAGSGGGQLVLIDHDSLAPGNLGRHLLGFESLLINKAEALAKMLARQFPQVNIVAEARKYRPSTDLAGDLVINATGEEALSVAINANWVELPKSQRPPVLHAWIVGNGECVQCLWVDNLKHACFRCMRANDPARSKRYPAMDADPLMRVIGCHAYTPYAVSAPMSAAALVVDAIIAWLKGNPTPRFRTRTVEGAKVRKLMSFDMTPLKDCPACSAPSS